MIALSIIVGVMTLYSFYVGGRLKQAESNIEILRAALNRHLETGEDFRSAKAALEAELSTTGIKVLK